MKPCFSTLFDHYGGLWCVFTVKKDTTLHNVLTYRVMPVCKYSHTRTCLCALVWLDRHVCTQMFNKKRARTHVFMFFVRRRIYIPLLSYETHVCIMSKVAHGRVLVSQNGTKSYRGQSSWSVVFRGQSFFVDGVYILWWLCTRIHWDIWLGKTAVNVWTNVRGWVEHV